MPWFAGPRAFEMSSSVRRADLGGCHLTFGLGASLPSTDGALQWLADDDVLSFEFGFDGSLEKEPSGISSLSDIAMNDGLSGTGQSHVGLAADYRIGSSETTSRST